MARYKITDVLAEASEKHPPIELETADGAVFAIPSIELWDDAVWASADAGPVEQAKALLGGERYAEFVAAGGSASVIQYVVQQELTARGVSPGESAAS